MAAGFLSGLKQFCSHGGHVKWPPARAELRAERNPAPRFYISRVWLELRARGEVRGCRLSLGAKETDLGIRIWIPRSVSLVKRLEIPSWVSVGQYLTRYYWQAKEGDAGEKNEPPRTRQIIVRLTGYAFPIRSHLARRASCGQATSWSQRFSRRSSHLHARWVWEGRVWRFDFTFKQHYSAD